MLLRPRRLRSGSSRRPEKRLRLWTPTSRIRQDREKAEKKAPEKKPAKKRRFGFLRDVRSELKRVTWPTKQDVFLRWSVVVVVALVFFGVYVAVLDNVVITPLLIAISGLGV